MGKCIRIRKKKRQYCSGDLIDEITIQDRNIVAPEGETDFGENFTDALTAMSAINTVSGKTYFDGAVTETPITHEVGIRFEPGITSESWILYDNRRFDILKVENLDERDQWLRIQCVDRGLASKLASGI